MELTDKQKEKLTTMRTLEENCIVMLGRISANRIDLRLQEDEIKEAMFENAKKRQELLKEIEEDLGPGSIDMQTMTFTPKED